jgi:hypothetical protein
MPRQSSRSGGRSSGFSSARSPSYGRATSPNTSSARPQATQQPAYTPQQTPPMQSSGGGMMSGLGSTIVQGVAFGGGSEVGRQVVRSMMGGSSNEPRESAPVENKSQPIENQQQVQQTQQNQNPCQGFNLKFIECLKTNNNDISSCQSVFNDLKLCQNSMI